MNNLADWKSNISINNLLKRAAIINQIRQFFNDRGLLEVETPAMSQTTVTDIHIVPFKTCFIGPRTAYHIPLYLITSPEYHMKRLLASGSGSIFQLCRSFRNEEIGRYHNPEFTILEWYRTNYDMFNLMNEVDDFLQKIINCDSAEILSYQEVFIAHIGIDPLSAKKMQLYNAAIKFNLIESISEKDDCDTLLQLLFTMVVEPNIGHDKPSFIYHFPASQAALAKINTEDHRVSDRFEVYFKGIELANGFCELTDSCEQRQRFEENNYKREAMKLDVQPIDEYFLTALANGMPECSGVALGVDRLIMLALKTDRLSDVIAFPVEKA
ncbi:Elongation factor P--(R)-beta-lysine ligase [Candidatus Gullanella endobia]|uniref:Elongation factor P--(R)-beta-lysine ligase n=1 Tax=Candidatus Gullanella endobia TaxID=1070130 RepID=A0A143WR09_9ENTR|nr:elongation factor P--(R)-beta-lysine ligase [Candidatus Gullanella endobia]CUX96140.1 Elongation factor P--(R)-beta-lysine ligase [Candidatus Gullanella endobia]